MLAGVSGGGDGALVSRSRQQEGLVRAGAALRGVDWSAGLELIADDLIRSLRALEGVVGVGVSEEMLDALFSEFCIGK